MPVSILHNSWGTSVTVAAFINGWDVCETMLWGLIDLINCFDLGYTASQMVHYYV